MNRRRLPIGVRDFRIIRELPSLLRHPGWLENHAPVRFGGAVTVLALALAAGPETQAQSLDFSGSFSLQSRWYPESPAFAGQRDHAGGAVAEPTLYMESANGASFTLTPFARYDSADSRRTHADLREAYLLVYGNWGANFWEFRSGVGRVFWGVAELHNLVDIVNQFDLIEHPREEAKLGQPMAHLTVGGDWGVAELLALPYHRERTFAGPSGRLRPGRLIVDDALYESSDKERHLDAAIRYSNSVGLVDFGLSAFAGTNREPFLVPAPQPGMIPDANTPLVPYYEQIRQFGLDAQLTAGPWLWKLEAIDRAGARNLLGREEDYRAAILGAERTVYAVFGSVADLTLLGEWHDDGRGARATNVWANDVFLAAHLALNDVAGTEIVAGLLGDLNRNYRALSLEARRRLSNRWSMRFELIANVDVDPRDITWDVRRDSFLAFDFNYNL